MHDNVNNVVHVEDKLVTWGNFFQNIGWGLGDDYLKTADNIYIPNNQNSLNFILNGKKVSNITNSVIGDQDKLLISYGNESSDQLNKQYVAIQNNALKYDNENDPSMCSGPTNVTIYDRLTHLF